MALVLKDRVKETSTTAGTGTITLAGAVAGFQSFSAVGNGNTTYYAIVDPTTGDWEVGIGTYTSSGTTLSRTTVLSSSNSGSLVSFAANVKDVFVTYPSEQAVWQDASGVVVQQDFGAITATSAALTTGTVSTTPASGTDIANKTYVDTLVSSGITYHTPVKYEVPDSTGNLNATYNNGASGVGATLTNAGTLAAFTPDGTVASVNDRVIIYNQTNQFENGVYTVTTVGSGSVAWVLTRATDADTYALKSPNGLGNGDAFFITSGATGAGETYVCNTVGTITFGTTAITFAQISDSTLYTAGTGLTLTGTEFSITPTGTAGTYGSASSVPVLTTNASGQVTSVTNTTIAINGSQVSGNIPGSAGSVANSLTLGTYLTGGSFNGSAAVTATVDATSANTASKVVARDSSGNFSAGTITATLSGSATSATTATNVAGGAANQLVYQSGSGTTAFATAPTVSSTYLYWNGSALAWGAITSGTVTSITAGAYLTGGTITTSGTIAVDATSANTASKVVARDASGNFSASTITASLSGNATTATTATNQSGGTVSATTGAFSSNITVGTGVALAPASVSGFGAGQITDSTSGFSAPGVVLGTGTGSHGAIVYGSGTMYFGTENGSASGTMTTRATLNNAGAFNTTGAITQNGSQVLTAGNYNSYAPTLTGTGASGTWSINVTGSAGSAGSVAWGNITSKPSYIMFYEGFTLDANTMSTNSTGFTYAINAPATGPIARLSTGGSYDLWLNAPYIGGSNLYFRTRNGDAGSYNSWQALASYGINYASTLYATTFYDSNDTGYYIDPASTSDTALRMRGGALFGPNTSWGEYLYVGTNGNVSGSATVCTTDGNIHIDASNSSHGIYLGYYTGDFTRIYNSTRTPILYDIDNTSYYLDPASTGTSLNTAGTGVFGNGGNDTGLGVYYGGGSGDYARIRFYQSGTNNSTIHVFSTTWQGGSLATTSTGAINLAGANGVTLGNWNVINSSGHWFDNSGNGQSSASFRSPIFYDSNNTTYYVDPNSWSYISSLNLGDGTSTAYYNANTNGLTFGTNTPGDYRIYTEIENYGGSYTKLTFAWHTGMRFYTYPTYGGVRFFNYTPVSGPPSLSFSVNEGDGNVRVYNNLYAPILYDLNNTGYYLDPNGTSNVSMTCTGLWYYLSNFNTGSGSNAPLQAFSSGGNGAVMSFHRGGYYAINMGLDSDNVFRIGGWSASANLFQMDMSGNLTMAGNVTAYSDETLKKDWADLPSDFVPRLARVKSGTYTRIDNGMRQIGVGAQSLRPLMEEAVFENADGTLSVAYGNAAMASSVELARYVTALEQRISQLEARL